MFAITAAWKVGDLLRFTFYFCLAGLVSEANHRVGVTDVDVTAPKRDTKRLLHRFNKREALFCDAIFVRVAKNKDLAGA